MTRRLPLLAAATALAMGLVACQPAADAPPAGTSDASAEPAATADAGIAAKVEAYAEVPLTADLSHLSEGDREAIRLLLQAGEIMDALFWEQVYGDKQALLAGIALANAGPRLPEAMQSRLFDSLVSLRAKPQRDEGGTHLGFGLHIAKLITELHRGHAEARNLPGGEGVEFTLHLRDIPRSL